MRLEQLFAAIPTLESDRLILRPFRYEDTDDVFSIYSNKEVGKYNAWRPISQRNEATLKIHTFKEQFEQGVRIRWGIEDKTSQRLIGDCAFVNFDFRMDRAEIGFNLNQEFWKKGLMSEALTLMISWGIEQQIHRFEALIHPENLGCLMLLKKLGFQQEGVLRNAGKAFADRYDLLLYALLSNELISSIANEKP